MSKFIQLEKRLLRLSVEEECMVELFRDLKYEYVGKNSRQYQRAVRKFNKNQKKQAIAWGRLNVYKLRNPNSKHYKMMKKKYGGTTTNRCMKVR